MKRSITVFAVLLLSAATLALSVRVAKAQEFTTGDTFRAYGTFVSVDTEKKTITISVKAKDATEATDVTYPLADTVKVLIGKDAKTLADLTKGMKLRVGGKIVDGKKVADDVRCFQTQ